MPSPVGVLLVAYLAVVVGPLLVAAVAFAVARLLQPRPAAAGGNGHAEPAALEHTVEEVPAP